MKAALIIFYAAVAAITFCVVFLAIDVLSWAWNAGIQVFY